MTAAYVTHRVLFGIALILGGDAGRRSLARWVGDASVYIS